MYNAEVATFRIRGALGTLNQLAVTVGLLLAQVFGLSGVLGSSTLWPILVGKIYMIYFLLSNSSVTFNCIQ